MITDEKVEKALEYISQGARKLAQAKANYDYLADYTKVLKAQLMKEHPKESAAGQEREAFSDPRYTEHLKVVKDAEGEYLHLNYLIDAAKVTLDIWRTQSSNERAARI
jgi:hypothetical protein